MATIRHGVVQIIENFLYIQINSDLYETLNLSSLGTNLSSQLQVGHPIYRDYPELGLLVGTPEA